MKRITAALKTHPSDVVLTVQEAHELIMDQLYDLWSEISTLKNRVYVLEEWQEAELKLKIERLQAQLYSLKSKDYVEEVFDRSNLC